MPVVTLQYTWKGLVSPMWGIIRFCTAMSDLTLVVSRASRVRRPLFSVRMSFLLS